MMEHLGTLLGSSLAQGSALAILIAFLFGVFVGFTPCVYPVLPITIAYIGRASRGSRLNALLYSLVYVLGMAVVYSAIGIIAALLGSQIGKLWSNGWVLLVLANFFLALALWQLGVIRLPTPQFMTGGGERRSGLLGALGVGAASGLIVGPCTLPGLAAMLALIQTGVGEGGSLGALLFGATAMFAYSLGLGSLIIICGVFSGILANMPKSGKWLATIEKVFAVLLILVAEFFLIYLGQSANFPLLSGITYRAKAPQVVPSSPSAAIEPGVEISTVKASVGAPAPGWALQDTDGKPARLEDYRGKKGVVMVFFSTWCAACMEEVPELIAFQQKYGTGGVDVVGVGIDQPLHTLKRFVEDARVNYRVVVDADSKVADLYGVTGVPLVVAVDSAGTVRFIGHALPKDKEALVRNLQPSGSR